MTENNQKELFSLAYIEAVAAAAGFNIGNWRIDDESVDVTLGARGGAGVVKSPRLEIQAKCTAAGSLGKKESLPFRLPMKNYDDLRDPHRLVPIVLVVVTVPKKIDSWLKQSHNQLAMKHCGLWLSLATLPEVPSDADNPKVTISLPKANLFSVDALKGMMDTIGKGGRP